MFRTDNPAEDAAAYITWLDSQPAEEPIVHECELCHKEIVEGSKQGFQIDQYEVFCTDCFANNKHLVYYMDVIMLDDADIINLTVNLVRTV